jgi:hypothetical protein
MSGIQLADQYLTIPGVDLKDTTKRYGAALVTLDGTERTEWILCTIESESGETVQARQSSIHAMSTRVKQ